MSRYLAKKHVEVLGDVPCSVVVGLGVKSNDNWRCMMTAVRRGPARVQEAGADDVDGPRWGGPWQRRALVVDRPSAYLKQEHGGAAVASEA